MNKAIHGLSFQDIFQITEKKQRNKNQQSFEEQFT